MRRHNELADKVRALANEISDAPIVPENSKFEQLARSLSSFSDNAIQWIRDGQRLSREGEYQHNCVFCYRRQITEDACAIFHMDRSDQSYTIRIEEERGRFYVAEMRARFNKPYLREDYAFVRGLVREVNWRNKGYDIPQQYNLFGEEVPVDLEGWIF